MPSFSVLCIRLVEAAISYILILILISLEDIGGTTNVSRNGLRYLSNSQEKCLKYRKKRLLVLIVSRVVC